MAELRRDPVVGRWVIIDTDHPSAPQAFERDESVFSGGTCPFCYGSEAITPNEIECIRDPNTAPNTPGWHVRVIPNKFPALQIEGDLERRGNGIYDMSNGIGAHEVLVESPYHTKDISELLNSEVENVISMYCRRAIDLSRDTRFKYIMFFRNYGQSAGASLEHPHTQLIALPMVPKSVLEELQGAQDYFNYRERCIFCDIIRQEMQKKETVILENKHFISFCPFVSRFPFEIWIIPKKHNAYFLQITKDEIPSLADILKGTLAKLKKTLSHPSYNYVIHTSPIDGGEGDAYHWHIEIMPRLTRVAGFEWGTGFYIVPTPPELAAVYLKEA